MRKITRTIYGSKLQTEQLLGMPFTFVPNTTLNEKFDIQSGVQPSPGQMPSICAFTIGNGGHRNAVGADGFPYTSLIQHDPADAALYKHLPFLLREPSNDLTVLERAKYGLRRQIVVAGSNYIAYYAKRVNFDDVDVQLLHNTVQDDVTTTVPFVPTGANLSPTPPPIPAQGVVTTNGTYLSVSSILNLSLSREDVAELIEVARLMYDNENYAVISEMGLVAAVPRVVNVPAPGGGTISYEELICAQITSHLAAHYSVGYTNEGFDYAMELGSTEALVGVSNP